MDHLMNPQLLLGLAENNSGFVTLIYNKPAEGEINLWNEHTRVADVHWW